MQLTSLNQNAGDVSPTGIGLTGIRLTGSGPTVLKALHRCQESSLDASSWQFRKLLSAALSVNVPNTSMSGGIGVLLAWAYADRTLSQ